MIITGRSADAVEAVRASAQDEGIVLDGLTLDVTDPASVRAAAKQIENTHGALDILVNNAGILPEAQDAGSHEFGSVRLFEETFETNVFGVVAVTEAFLPSLKRSDSGRIVNVSTRMGSLADQADSGSPYYSMVVPAYQASKAALNSITIALSKTLSGRPIIVTSVCPGYVKTDLTPSNREQAPSTPEEAASVIVRAALAPAGAPSGTFVDADGTVPW